MVAHRPGAGRPSRRPGQAATRSTSRSGSARPPTSRSWDAPFGPGRPGWHIECSAMALAAHGPTLDLHGGGTDLIFPHHESEIAQSTAVTGQPLARHWMHSAMVAYDGEKMSKSLGNLVFVSDLLKVADPRAIRLALLRHHYRAGFEWFDTDLDEGKALLRRLLAAADCGSTRFTAADPRPFAEPGAGRPRRRPRRPPGPRRPRRPGQRHPLRRRPTRRRPAVLLELAELVGVDLTLPAPIRVNVRRLGSAAVLAGRGGGDGRPRAGPPPGRRRGPPSGDTDRERGRPGRTRPAGACGPDRRPGGLPRHGRPVGRPTEFKIRPGAPLRRAPSLSAGVRTSWSCGPTRSPDLSAGLAARYPAPRRCSSRRSRPSYRLDGHRHHRRPRRLLLHVPPPRTAAGGSSPTATWRTSASRRPGTCGTTARSSQQRTDHFTSSTTRPTGSGPRPWPRLCEQGVRPAEGSLRPAGTRPRSWSSCPTRSTSSGRSSRPPSTCRTSWPSPAPPSTATTTGDRRRPGSTSRTRTCPGSRRDFQLQTFHHEFTHVAAFPLAGPFVPSWVHEGVADWMASRRAGAPATVDGSDGVLPEDWEFTTGGGRVDHPGLRREHVGHGLPGRQEGQDGAPSTCWSGRGAPGGAGHAPSTASTRASGPSTAQASTSSRRTGTADGDE